MKSVIRIMDHIITRRTNGTTNYTQGTTLCRDKTKIKVKKRAWETEREQSI